MTTAGKIIERYRLQPHPEGGWYREIHRSGTSIGVPDGYPGPRTACTGIYYLLGSGEVSVFHRVRSEEVWIHLAGAPLELVVLSENPAILTLASVAEGGEPLAVVPPQTLQAARTLGEFTLVSCIVAPAFDYEDFGIPGRKELLCLYPEHEALIRRFTRQVTLPRCNAPPRSS